MEDSIYSEIHLNSKFRTTGTQSKPSYIISPALYVDHVKVKNVQLPVTWYGINPYNNSIVFYESDTASTVRMFNIPPGNYNSSTLIDAMETGLNAMGTQVYEVSISVPSQVLTVHGADKAFMLNFVEASSGDLLGFDNIETASLQTIVGSKSIKLNSTEAVYVVSNGIKSNTLSPGFTQSILCKIPLTVNSGQIEHYDSSACSFDIFPVSQHLNQIDLMLLDATTLRELDLNDASWSCTLSCWS